MRGPARQAPQVLAAAVRTPQETGGAAPVEEKEEKDTRNPNCDDSHDTIQLARSKYKDQGVGLTST